MIIKQGIHFIRIGLSESATLVQIYSHREGYMRTYNSEEMHFVQSSQNWPPILTQSRHSVNHRSDLPTRTVTITAREHPRLHHEPTILVSVQAQPSPIHTYHEPRLTPYTLLGKLAAFTPQDAAAASTKIWSNMFPPSGCANHFYIAFHSDSFSASTMIPFQ